MLVPVACSMPTTPRITIKTADDAMATLCFLIYVDETVLSLSLLLLALFILLDVEELGRVGDPDVRAVLPYLHRLLTVPTPRQQVVTVRQVSGHDHLIDD